MTRSIAALVVAAALGSATQAAEEPERPECRNARLGIPAEAVPMRVPGMADVANVFAVWGVTAIKRDGAVLNWFAAKGCDRGRYDPPALVTARTDVISFAIGQQTLDILRADGTVWQSTRPWYGEPRQMLTEARSIAAGHSHTLALRKDGTVWAWGYHGECGEGGVPASDVGNSYPSGFGPRQIKGLDRIVAISAGKRVSVALRSDGTVWWWGNLTPRDMRRATWQAPLCRWTEDDPNPRPEPQPVPQRVQRLSGVVAIASGYMHHVALKRDGSVWGWGLNDCGQAGVAPGPHRYPEEFLDTPVQVAGISKAKAIAAGLRHSLALTADGTVFAWGEDSRGQLEGSKVPFPGRESPAPSSCSKLFPDAVGGAEPQIFRALPARVPGLKQVTAVAAGGFSSIALKRDGTVWVWGAK